MCGRYTIFTDYDELELLQIIDASARKYGDGSFKTGEIFPTDTVPVLAEPFFTRPSLMRWGIMGVGSGKPIINARRESVCDKPLFSEAFRLRRCIVPSTGYYEWDKDKTKYLFKCNRPAGAVYMAGIFNDNNFAIITGEANASCSSIHKRMPLVLKREDLRGWLCDEVRAREIIISEIPQVIATSLPA